MTRRSSHAHTQWTRIGLVLLGIYLPQSAEAEPAVGGVSPISSASIAERIKPVTRTSDVLEIARHRWRKGARALEAGDLEEARSSFQAAYDALPKPELAQSLGVVEYRTQHFADAARHLTLALESQHWTREQRESTKECLDKALESVGTLVMKLGRDSEGADLLLDGELIGRLPLPQQWWWVDPGGHVVTLHLDGYADEVSKVDIQGGHILNISLGVSHIPESGTVVRRVEPSPPAVGRFTPIRFNPELSNDAEQTTSSNARTVALVTGATLTAVSAGFGGYLLLQRGADQDQAGKLHGAVVAAIGPNGCASQPSMNLCEQLADRYHAVDRDKKWAIASFGAAGVVGVATAATFLFWPRQKVTTVRVAPAASGVGIVVGGDF